MIEEGMSYKEVEIIRMTWPNLEISLGDDKEKVEEVYDNDNKKDIQ